MNNTLVMIKSVIGRRREMFIADTESTCTVVLNGTMASNMLGNQCVDRAQALQKAHSL